MMKKVLRVARTEYLNAVRTKAFVVSVVLMPVLMGGSILVQLATKDRADTETRKVAIVDQSGRIYDALEAAAKKRNETAIFKTNDDGERKQKRPRYVLESAPPGQELELSERVRKGDLFAYVVIGADVTKPVPDSAGGDESVSYHTETPTYRDLPRWIESVLQKEVLRQRFEAQGVDRQLVAKLSRRVDLRTFGLVAAGAQGKTGKAKEVNKIATVAVPMGAMLLLFMLLMMTGPAMLNAVLEEKMQKISEVLISSVSPFQLFFGKVLGNVGVAWTLSGLYLGGIIWLSHRFEFSDAIPPSLYLWFFFLQLMALLIAGSVFTAIGAACSELRDAQSLMMPAMLMFILPMFCASPVLQNPSGVLARVLTFVPPATPFILLMRIAVPPGPQFWEVIVAVLLVVAFALGCVWAGGRIFRIGVLSQGQTPSFRKMIGWAFAKD